MSIHAPYNFVPLNETVYTPDYIDEISHDIPFSDGVSGCIKLKLLAETPIFVRNGHTRQDAEGKNENYQAFSHVDDHYFIPGTSIKGAIRSVFEILTNSKIGLINNDLYSIRDLNIKEYMGHFNPKKTRCGWLYKENGKIIIEDAGIPFRISHDEIDQAANTELHDFVRKETFRDDQKRNAIYKYDQFLRSYDKEISFIILPPPPPPDYRTFVEFSDTDTGNRGIIVMTGQPGRRNDEKVSGKNYEFVFQTTNKSGDTYNASEYYEDFKFIYNDSEDWNQLWKPQFEAGKRIPIFFTLEGAGKNAELLHYGLSYLYKLPFPKRIKEYLHNCHKNPSYDLAESVFGSIEDSSEHHLKGRVHFGHAFTSDGRLGYKKEIYMASPKPTYYPTYLIQENGKLLKTMLDQNAELKGRKRYPVKAIQSITLPDNLDEKNKGFFTPIKEGATFNQEIHFHNLRQEELGALLKSLTLPDFSHSIGFAKSYGYGRLKLEITDYRDSKNRTIKEINYYVNLFNQKSECKNKHEMALTVMGKVQDIFGTLDYMTLEDHSCYKREKTQESLPYYKDMIKSKPAPPTEPKTINATVVFTKPLKVRLDGNDTIPKELIMVDSSVKLKMNDRLIVEQVGRNSPVKFIKKI